MANMILTNGEGAKSLPAKAPAPGNKGNFPCSLDYNTQKGESEGNTPITTLLDELWHITEDLKKARLLLDDMISNYFEIYDENKEEDRFQILVGFNRNRTLAKIVDDYMFSACEALEELEEDTRRTK